ncbi:unnamed protein product [Didymodactylos carnosus]|uniref:Elongation of very long chain fatty acids protein n=1 Tax=Didymodactylos carnosus TaxID=1234261 RepID=A0A813PEL7_9BILA|nr:unnamed protein product [Didymodactylos carnosus]CAF3533971.1 unnamed protein product [Didymodactylos carnosus]
MYIAGGQGVFIIIINSFVHVVMYGYYALAALGPKMQKYLWWKKYLTQFQLFQFVMVIIQALINLSVDCNFPKAFSYSFLLYAISILALFLNFYFQSYIKERRKRRESK